LKGAATHAGPLTCGMPLSGRATRSPVAVAPSVTRKRDEGKGSRHSAPLRISHCASIGC